MGGGAGEADEGLRQLRDLRVPTELRDMCLSYVLYHYQAEEADLHLYHPEMFSSHVRWDRFETKDAGSYIRVSEGGKTIENNHYEKYATARAARWISSLGSASGTVTLPGDEEDVDVGIILRGQRDMNMWIGHSGTSWYY